MPAHPGAGFLEAHDGWQCISLHDPSRTGVGGCTKERWPLLAAQGLPGERHGRCLAQRAASSPRRACTQATPSTVMQPQDTGDPALRRGQPAARCSADATGFSSHRGRPSTPGPQPGACGVTCSADNCPLSGVGAPRVSRDGVRSRHHLLGLQTSSQESLLSWSPPPSPGLSGPHPVLALLWIRAASCLCLGPTPCNSPRDEGLQDTGFCFSFVLRFESSVSQPVYN